jgi:hypothetical protein
MDLENQKRVLDLSEKYGKENMAVIIGTSEAESAGLTAETVTAGDPTFAGPLAGVSLGLRVYHIFELKDQIDANVYDDQCGMMEMVLDVDAINSEVKSIRDQYCQFKD